MSNIKQVGYGGSRLQLKRFPIEKMQEHCTIAMIAKRASGKSYLTREILYHKRKLPATVVISRTEKLNRFYGEFCPDSYIYDEFDTEILTNIYARQSKLKNNSKICGSLSQSPLLDMQSSIININLSSFIFLPSFFLDSLS